MKYRIFPVSESVVTIDFGNEISVALNEKVVQFAKKVGQNPFEGFIETVPAYSSVAVFFDLRTVRKCYPQFASAFSFVSSFLERTLDAVAETAAKDSEIIRIPVAYEREFAPDLNLIADHAGLEIDEVIKLHTAKTYRVFMIGFLPAFAYMGEVDERIAMPRKQTPRTRIEKGSVGIAGRQTGIYPLESPGGWQIIGRTELELFRPESAEISLLKTGDLVRFYDRNKVQAGKNH